MFKNISIYFVGKTFSQLFNFLSTLLLISYLVTEDFGLYTYYLEVIMIFVTILEVGTRSIYVREFSKTNDKLSLLNSLFFNHFFLYLIISVALLSTVYALSDSAVALFSPLLLLPSLFVPFISFLVSLENATRVIKINLSIAVSKVLLFIYLINVEVSWDLFLSFFLVNSLLYLFLFRSEIRLLKFTTPVLLPFFKMIIPMSALALFSILYNKVDIFMLEWFCGYESVGNYSVIYRLILPFTFISSSVYLVLLPRFSNGLIADGRIFYISTILFFVGLLISFFLSFFFYFFGEFLFESYSHLKLELFIFSLYLPIVFFYGVLSNYLVSADRISLLIYINVISLFINVVFNYLLLVDYEVLGAVLSTIVSELFIMVSLVLILRFRFYEKS
jgi:O-antigen/teichoic acid export membrane protein